MAQTAGGASERQLTLFHAVPSRSMIVRWMLEEVGAPYDVRLVRLSDGEHLTSDFKKVNPKQKVPALKHGDVIITEVAAICCYLADEFPEADLAPKILDARRGPYLSWLFFGPSCIEPAVLANTHGWTGARRGTVGWGTFESVLDVLRDLAKDASPYIFGDQFTAADVVIGSQIRYGRMFGTLPKDAALDAYVARLEERPAMQRQIAKDNKLS